MRGQAGTHDIKLARDILQQLKSADSDSSEVALVRYDKTSHGGRGDRAPKSAWQQVKGKVDIVLFEGWMLGFRPLTDEAAQKVIGNGTYDVQSSHCKTLMFAVINCMMLTVVPNHET